MTTTTLSTYYCAFCAAVAKIAKKTFTKIIKTFEAAGRARAAAELARQGYHKEARAIILGKSVEEV